MLVPAGAMGLCSLVATYGHEQEFALNETMSNPRPLDRQIFALVVFVLLCFAAAGIGNLFTAPQIPGWYAKLAKPDWTPPSWLFGPVWSLLYLMMAVAAWLVWRRGELSRNKLPLIVFFIQLALNTLWSVLFFGLQQPGYAAIEIVALLLAIGATAILFARRSPLAAALLVPYLLWVSFATALNIAIWSMNR